MDKERLRIASDSSSGSSSRSGVSTNQTNFRTGGKPAFMLGSNSFGPPPSSPSFSPHLPSSPQTLAPPPGLPHPGSGGIYQFPHCPSPGFQNINYLPGMTALPVGQSQVPARFPPVIGGHNGHGQYNMNGYAVHNNMIHTPTTSPPSGYNMYGNHPNSRQTFAQGCSMHPSQQQAFNASQHASYNQSSDSYDLEKRLGLLLSSTNSGSYDNSASFGDFLPSQLITRKEELTDAITSGNVNKEEKLQCKSGGVMNPIIENLVGSMSMSNGTYTHFGPSVSTTNSASKLNDQTDFFNEISYAGRQNINSELDRQSLFSQTASSPETTDIVKENIIGSMGTGSKQPNVGQIASQQMQEDFIENNFVNSNISMVAVGSSTSQPRASSPRDPTESSSRPQTPGKPSYLEVLTKAGMKAQQPSSRKTSSTSSSPVQSTFTGSSENVPSLAHRKSVDYFVATTSSTPSSSCPSASSSPATKPRGLTTGTLLKGKENVANYYMKQSGVARSSPSSSPTHNVQNQQSKGKIIQMTSANDRKILSSQNSTSGAKSGKSLKNGKVASDKSVDAEECNDEGDWGWKTYTSRGRNNNLSNVGNKNSQKRTSNGHCSTEPAANNLTSIDDDDSNEDQKTSSNEDVVMERKLGSSSLGSSGNTSATAPASSSHSRKSREKEKPRNRKEDRNCVSRRLETLAYIWLTHLISALAWLWSLVTDVVSLSASLGVSLLNDLYQWTITKALPNFTEKIARWRKDVRQICLDCWQNLRTKFVKVFTRGGSKGKRPEESASSKSGIRHDESILSLLGPDRNISLPANGDEALKRLLSVKGQDPYSILGVKSDSSEETIRRYYKRQAVLVHPDKNLIVGAEEAFKILARAFEMVGDPIKRAEYHQKLLEAQAKEKFCGEIGNLLEQLRKKMEAASSTIRCTKCNSRHKKNVTDRPLFAARYCSQCRIHHGAREGELWAERGGWFGITWNYFACMDAHVWEINEWARCQKTNLKHIKADAHCVMYRLVAGGNNQQNHNQHCHGNEGDGFGAGSEADEWDSLINNLCKSPPGSAFGKTTNIPGKAGCCGNGGMNGTGTNAPANQTAGKRRKGKRNK